MNCQAVQNQILGLPTPLELPPALREHVLACPGCRVWARRAARLEAILAQLPVPAAPAEKKESMIGDLMAADPVIQPMVTPAARPGLGSVAGQFLLRNATYVGGLAAAVLVVVGISSMWPSKPPVNEGVKQEEKHPLLRKLATREVAMARAETTAKKLDVLSGMADDIATDARGMARIASGSDLKQMAGWYEDVVKSGLVPRAKELQNQPQAMPAAEKTRILDALAAKLDADATAAENLARESPPDAQPALKRLAEAAREGKESLRTAAGGGK